MIKESARLREEAAEALNKIHKCFEEELSFKVKKPSSSVNIQQIINSKNKRFEASLYTDTAQAFLDTIINLYDHHKVGEMTLNLFTEGIFKREYVEKGHPFMMGSEILKAIPTPSKSISFKQAARKKNLFVEEGWLLMTCSGSVGDIVYVDKQLSEFIYTHDLIRIVPKDKENQLYLFAFLSSPIGKKLVNHFKYGSVIQHLEAFHVSDIPVPILHEKYQEIVSEAKKHIEFTSKAKHLELEAISLVEQEIEKWSK